MPANATQTLVDLGLTLLQAKVYLALAKLGTSTGRVIARESKVAPQDVYRLLKELHEKGLVEKVIDKPNKYTAIGLDDGLSILIKRRKKVTGELEKAAAEISQSMKEIEDLKKEVDEIGNFILIPEKEPMEIRISRIFHTARKTIDYMNDFQEGINNHERFFDVERLLIDKGVRFREIFVGTKPEYRIPESLLSLLERYPIFQARSIDICEPAKLIIKDGNEVLISTKTDANSSSQPYLWSNNKILVNVIQQWYNGMWERAVDANSNWKVRKVEILSAGNHND